MGLHRCATALVGTACLDGSEPRQPLPQETVAVGQPLLFGERLGGVPLSGFVPCRTYPAVRSARPALPEKWGGGSSRGGVGRAERPGEAGASQAQPIPQLLTLCPGLAPQVTMCDRKAVIKNADMSEEMQQDSVECATQALEKYNIEKDIAAHIKKVRTGRGRGVSGGLRSAGASHNLVPSPRSCVPRAMAEILGGARKVARV